MNKIKLHLAASYYSVVEWLGYELWILRRWGPFLESPGNFTGPKSNIQIEI